MIHRFLSAWLTSALDLECFLSFKKCSLILSVGLFTMGAGGGVVSPPPKPRGVFQKVNGYLHEDHDEVNQSEDAHRRTKLDLCISNRGLVIQTSAFMKRLILERVLFPQLCPSGVDSFVHLDRC